MSSSKFLSVHKTHILHNGHPVLLKGVNLGGWLMMEGYILHALNVAEQVFKKNFAAKCGERALRDFEKAFRENFITKRDFETIAALGFNCVRVPFHYRLIEPVPYHYDVEGMRYLEKVMAWAAQYRLWIILDLHAAPGSQNHDWHSDSLGTADLWKKKEFQDRTVALWRFLAGRFSQEPWLAGYDILNEAVTGDTRLLNTFYRRIIQAIREKDRGHLIFVEGNTWAMDLECLDAFDDLNLALSIHFYHPLDFTFNFVPGLHYPVKSPKETFDQKSIARMLERYLNLSKRLGRPIFVGEFGVNVRQGQAKEHKWVEDAAHQFTKNGFHWTYWTYKAVKNSVFPDGLFSYMGNPPWVRRQGPLLGWDNYAECWKKNKKDMVLSWRTENFQPNEEIINVLKNSV